MLKSKWLVEANRKCDQLAYENWIKQLQRNGGCFLPEQMLDYDTHQKSIERLERSLSPHDGHTFLGYLGYK